MNIMNMKWITPFLMLYVTATTSYIKGVCWKGTTNLVSVVKPIITLRLLRTSLNTKKYEGTEGYLKTLSIHKIMNTNIVNRINETTCDQINITSVYLNIDKVNAVYFAKDVKNVIFTLPYDLADLYYYDKVGEVIYKISNKTRINLKNINRFVFQSFNNNVDGILF
jgi:hypothetical protein